MQFLASALELSRLLHHTQRARDGQLVKAFNTAGQGRGPVAHTRHVTAQAKVSRGAQAARLGG